MALSFVPTIISEVTIISLIFIVFIHGLLGATVVRVASAAQQAGRQMAYIVTTLLEITVVAMEIAIAPEAVADSVKSTTSLIQAAAVGGILGAGVVVTRTNLTENTSAEGLDVGSDSGTAETQELESDEASLETDETDETDANGPPLPDLGFDYPTDEDGYPVLFRNPEEVDGAESPDY